MTTTLLNVNYYKIFYWITVADSVKNFLFIMSIIFAVIAGLSFIGGLWSSTEMSSEITSNETQNRDYKQWEVWQKHWRRIFNWTIVPAIIFIGAYIFTPSKKDCLLIVTGGAVGNFVTSDSSSRAIPAEMTKYLHLALKEKISDLNSETRVELGLQTSKEKFIDKAAKMTKHELIEYLKNDTTLVK